MHMKIHIFLNTSIECLCVVREKLDRASILIELFKTLTKKLFECPYSCVRMNMDTKKFFNQSFKISYCSWDKGFQIQLKSNIELYDNKI